ncbi:ThiF family adenylyltransferase [bacterium]|nr:ThiF family adenylyltransferase [bacterium]
MLDKRYSRLERYSGMAATLARWQETTAAVVGLGGLGGGLAMHLARFGVGKLILIDRDVAGPENLGYQALFTEEHAQARLPKAVAAKQTLSAINSMIELEACSEELTRHNIGKLLHGADLVFDGLDNYATRFLLSDYALAHGAPYFYAGVVRGELSARAIISKVTGCLRCLMDKPPQAGEVPTCAAEGVFPPLLAVANALQLSAANAYLAGEFTQEQDILYSLSMEDWRLRQVKLGGPEENCPACGQGHYDYLDGTMDTHAASACAGERVTMELGGSEVDLHSVRRQLAAAGNGGFSVKLNEYCLVAEEDGLRYTLFPSGRIVLQGSGDPAVLNRFAATYLGL